MKTGDEREDQLTIRFAAVLADVARCRDAVRAFVNRHDAESEIADDLQLVVSELVTNVIQHTDVSSGIVAVTAEPDRFVIEVSAADGVPDPAGRTLPPATATSGRGLLLVRAVTDDFAIVDVDGERVARCTKLR